MDALVALLVGLIAAAAAYLFKDTEARKARVERDILDLELKKQAKKQKVREAAIRTETAKVAYEETKKKFMDRYGDIISNANRDGAASDGSTDES